MRRAALIGIFLAVLALSQKRTVPYAPAQQTHIMQFWGAPGFERDKRFVEEKDGFPCGPVVAFRVERMPPIWGLGKMRPEEAVELSASGKAVQRWAVPSNFFPRMIEGDWLLASADVGWVWLSPNGEIRPSVEGFPEDLPWPRYEGCAWKGTTHLEGEGICFQLKDRKSGKLRRISSWPPCT